MAKRYAGHASQHGGRLQHVKQMRLEAKHRELIKLADTGDPDEIAGRYPDLIREIRMLARQQRVKGTHDWFCAPLRDGHTVGYFQRRTDDCLQAALASLLQMPPNLVPDLALHDMIASGVSSEEIERTADKLLDEWQQRSGLAMRLRAVLPATGWWIGVTYSGQCYSDHCLLMRGREVMFDPSRLAPTDEEEAAAGYKHDDIYYAITIDGR